MEVGEKIKKYLEENGIKQSHLASKVNMPLARLNQSLNGNRKLTFEEYETICWALNVGIDKFLEPRMPKGCAV